MIRDIGQSFRPDEILCINRKMHEQEPKPRQDAFIVPFAKGCNGTITSWEAARPHKNTLCIRGMKYTAAIQECWANNRDFYYMDNGYLGNVKRKYFFRIIKNQSHDIRPIIERPRDRLSMLEGIKLLPFRPGKRILIAPPSPKSFSLWDMVQDIWIQQTITEIKKYTNRPIDIRLKRPRGERLTVDTMEEELANNVHCLVTYNSVAAVEALMLGRPVFTLGPNAAGKLGLSDLSKIETPYIPTDDERESWLRHLSYSQFTFEEMANGVAWKILTE